MADASFQSIQIIRRLRFVLWASESHRATRRYDGLTSDTETELVQLERITNGPRFTVTREQFGTTRLDLSSNGKQIHIGRPFVLVDLLTP